MASAATQLDDFADEARKFCRWATGGDGTNMTPPSVLRRVSKLYVAALELPESYPDGLSDELPSVEPLPESMDLVTTRVRALPLQMYWEIFAPIEDPPDDPVVGSITDDLSDIYRDVARGLILFESGHRGEALWQWAFNFRIHWGEHATSAIRAFHAYLSQEGLDVLSRDA